MNDKYDRQQQIIVAHAPLIVHVVRACQNADLLADLERVLHTLAEYGQAPMVGVIRRILAGSRDAALLKQLDDDDAVVISAILRGLQNPSTLPDINAKPEASAAAPGLASIIHAAAHGQPEALNALANMAEQMNAAGGDMARLSAIMRRLLNGERDSERLCKGMGAQGESLVLSILAELTRLEPH